MRIPDLLWMAIKNLIARWVVPIVGMTAISAFCLCFAGTVLTTVQQEKSLPYELNVIPGTINLSDSAIVEISDIPDVTAATLVLQIPANVQIGEYDAQLTLSGIDAAYLNEAFSQGGVFTDNSVMPYIVLNKAACKLFTEENIGGGAKLKRMSRRSTG